ncbi:LOW QUALITY PROTEIN: CKLF-like MARVEL transmembrane domain-containing protein 8b [Anableps anableps]
MLPLLQRHSWEKFTVPLCPCIMDRTAVVPTRRVSSLPQFNISTSTLAFDQHFNNAKGILLLAEILSGMLVWILIGGTDYFHLSALCWVMFVTILLWILTICLFIIYLTGVHNRIPHIPWTTLSLCFNCSAAALYLVTAVIEAVIVNQAIRGRHNYRCWAASVFQRLWQITWRVDHLFTFFVQWSPDIYDKDKKRCCKSCNNVRKKFPNGYLVVDKEINGNSKAFRKTSSKSKAAKKWESRVSVSMYEGKQNSCCNG